MAREDPLFRLRMPEDMKSTLQQAAKRNRRSLNAEIVARLESTMPASASGASVAEEPGPYGVGLELTEPQARALHAFLQAMEAEPLVHASEYRSPHAEPASAHKVKKVI